MHSAGGTSKYGNNEPGLKDIEGFLTNPAIYSGDGNYGGSISAEVSGTRPSGSLCRSRRSSAYGCRIFLAHPIDEGLRMAVGTSADHAGRS